MAKKKLFKSKTNFTLKRLHQSGEYGNIYERDYTTIVNSYSQNKSQIPIYNSPSFKLTIGSGLNQQKKYIYGNWLSNPLPCEGQSDKIWSLSCLPELDKKVNKICLKPNTSKITDFACYGSAYELIKSSLSDIIYKYPGELYITKQTIEESGLLNSGTIVKETDLYKNRTKYKDFFIVENPLSIDITQEIIPDDTQLSPIRFMCESYNLYNIISEDESVVISGNYIDANNPNYKFWDVMYVSNSDNKECLLNGDLLCTVKFAGGKLLIYCFFYENNILYLANTRKIDDIIIHGIRPNNKCVNEFFENLDDFERILLNQYTNYKSKFETYIEDDEYGWTIYDKYYQWPISNGGWNLSINGISYSNYISELSKLALNYDELFTDAIWRTMTHESISNMDLTGVIKTDEEDNSVGISKLRNALSIIGRQFDDIKKYADNIKNSNRVSYGQENNIPDYFLSDTLELSGWETKDILNYIPNQVITNSMYGARTIGFNSSEANFEFMRRLKLNSHNIFSKKGTKQGIEDLMSIFGFHSTDWLKRYYGNSLYSKSLSNDYYRSKFRKSFMLIEYVYVAEGYNKPENIELDDLHVNVKRINELKDSYSLDNINSANIQINEYDKLPLAEVTYGDKTRVIPWFDKNLEYDGDLYFQCNGGWGRNDGEIDKLIIVDDTKIYYYVNKDNQQKGYYQFINKSWKKIDENNLPNNIKLINIDSTNIYCVLVETKYMYYKFIEDDKAFVMATNNDIISILPQYDYTISQINVVDTKEDLFNLLYAYLKNDMIYYVNDIGKYYKLVNIDEHLNDNGWHEIDFDSLEDAKDIYRIQNIIDTNKGNNPHTGNYDNGRKYVNAYESFFTNSEFNNVDKESISGYDEYGFNIKRQADSTKCLFFGKKIDTNTILYPLRGENKISPYNLFENSEDCYDEVGSLSVINSKELHIIFDKEYKDFIETDILPYLKQIIPSTTIFSYSFETLGIRTDEEIFQARSKQVVCDGDICPIYGVV